MGRNRSKVGVLADNAQERINKFLAKLIKVRKYKRSLLKKLERDIMKEEKIRFYPDEDCQERVERIKAETTRLRKEVRTLEKDLKISRKQSQEFGKEIIQKKGKSKSEKLTGRKYDRD